MEPFDLKELRIPIAQIPPAGVEIRIQTMFPGAESNRTLCFTGPVDVRCRITVLGQEYWVELTAEADGAFECDRCCAPFTRRIRGQVKTLYTREKSKSGLPDRSDIRFMAAGTNELDLSADLTDALVLALPSKRLCREDCAGLCPGCGANLNETSCGCGTRKPDPRWEALEKLKRP
ncbi:DUF177 domain-containing protein [bacterium]|nr:DUF177 domain-containing protein [bacterium]